MAFLRGISATDSRMVSSENAWFTSKFSADLAFTTFLKHILKVPFLEGKSATDSRVIF